MDRKQYLIPWFNADMYWGRKSLGDFTTDKFDVSGCCSGLVFMVNVGGIFGVRSEYGINQPRISSIIYSSRYTLKEVQDIVDAELLKQGYKFLTQDQFDKYAILL